MHERYDGHTMNMWMGMGICFLAVVAVFMLTGHRTHLVDFLPYLLILACPLMHMFMHRGHSHTDAEGCHRDGVARAQHYTMFNSFFGRFKRGSRPRSKDPICGMEATDVIAIEYHGREYSFCSDHCRRKFEEDPERLSTKQS